MMTGRDFRMGRWFAIRVFYDFVMRASCYPTHRKMRDGWGTKLARVGHSFIRRDK
jgi:hypothetical protein